MFRFTMRAAIAVLVLSMAFTTAFAADRLSMDSTADDGTYKTVTVSNAEDCSALCREDKMNGILCRGVMTYQADITKDVYECRLNNGLGEKSAFKIEEPAPWTLQEALADLNAYRAEYGLNALTLNAQLIAASDVHAKDLADHGIAAHEGTDGSTHSDRVQREGYYFKVAAENVATGQKSWPAVFQAWKDSKGHNKNLLLEDATEFGVALVFEPTTEYATYWTMLVAAPLPNFTHPPMAATVEQLERMSN